MHEQSDTYLWVSKLTIIGSDNGLSPGRHQVVIKNNAKILFTRTFGTTFSEIIEKSIWTSRLEMATILSRSQCIDC